MFQSARRYLPSAAARLHQFRHEVADTSCWALTGTTFNLLNGTTGPGLLTLPLTFARCGWLLGSIQLITVFAFNRMSLGYLLKACLTTREHSYIGLSLRCGVQIASLVDWASLAFFFGSCVSYLVIIGDSFDQVTAQLGTGPIFVGGEVMHFSTLALLLLVLFTALCLAPLSMLRSMDSLQITSGIAMVCILFAVSVVVLAPGVTAAPTDVTAFELSAQSILSLPTMAFCFASQSLFPPALETLHQPATYDHMNSVVNVTMYLTLILHLLVALGGYLRFGSAVAPNILDSYPQSTSVGCARAAIVLAFAFTFPMMIFLCRMHIQSILARWKLTERTTDKPGPEGSPPEEHHILISLVLVGGALTTAIIFPNIDAIFGLLGGTTAVVISFVAPALFWDNFVGYMYPWRHPDKLFCRSLIAFGMVILGLAIIGFVVDLFGTNASWWMPAALATAHAHKGVGEGKGLLKVDVAKEVQALADAASPERQVGRLVGGARGWVEGAVRERYDRIKGLSRHRGFGGHGGGHGGAEQQQQRPPATAPPSPAAYAASPPPPITTATKAKPHAHKGATTAQQQVRPPPPPRARPREAAARAAPPPASKPPTKAKEDRKEFYKEAKDERKEAKGKEGETGWDSKAHKEKVAEALG